MIDTDKYEGHVLVDGKWASPMRREEYDATKALIKDAPLLVEELKRLRKGIKEVIQHLTYPAKYDKEVQEQTDKLKEMIE